MAGTSPDNTLEFHIRLVPQGRVTGYVANELRVGDTVRVSGPMGSAYLRRQHTGSMLCVAGGTGLAPILSIVRGAYPAFLLARSLLFFSRRPDRFTAGNGLSHAIKSIRTLFAYALYCQRRN